MIDLAQELKTIDRLLFQGGPNAQEISDRMDNLFMQVHGDASVVTPDLFQGLSSEFLQTVLMGWALSFMQFREAHMEEAKPSGLN